MVNQRPPVGMNHARSIQKPDRPELARCKILVPLHLVDRLESRLRTRGLRISDYLPILLRLARRRALALPSVPRYTTFYQAPGQDLQDVNFSVAGRQWGEFKLIARGCNVSMCFLFVHLMLQDTERSRRTGLDGEASLPYQMELREIVEKPGKSIIRSWYAAIFRPDQAG